MSTQPSDQTTQTNESKSKLPEFGAIVVVNGTRPPWLQDTDFIKIHDPDSFGLHNIYTANFFDEEDWYGILVIRLMSDHWAYKPLSQGFRPWLATTDSIHAPSDFSGEKVLLKSGTIFETIDNDLGKHLHWYSSDLSSDIIGYSRNKPQSSTDSPSEEVNKLKQELEKLRAEHAELEKQFDLQTEVRIVLDQELKKVRSHNSELETANKEWMDKTKWIQDTYDSHNVPKVLLKSLGRHRADIISTLVFEAYPDLKPKTKRVCSYDGCYRTESCGPGCRDKR